MKAAEINIESGQECNKLLIIKMLIDEIGIDDFFEQVEKENATSAEKLFGADTKIVSNRNFKLKLILEQ